MKLPLTGGCLCDSIRYEITGVPNMIYACHCTDCQRMSGSAFSVGVVFPDAYFRLTHGEPKSYARLADSGHRLEGWSCPICGTRTFGSPRKGEGAAEAVRTVRGGTLDDTSWLVPSIHFWTRSAHPWVRIPDEAIAFETQPSREWIADRFRERSI